METDEGVDNKRADEVIGLGRLLGYSSPITGSEGHSSRLRPCIAEMMDTSRNPVILLGKGETGVGFERNDMTRASFLGAPWLLQSLKGVAMAEFENVGKMGLPLVTDACPDPPRVLAVGTFLAFGPPLENVDMPALVAEGFCLPLCSPVELVFTADFACEGIRLFTAAGLGKVDV